MNRIETQSVPAKDRIAYWRTEMARTTGLHFDVDPKSIDVFEMHSLTYAVGALAVGQVWGVGHGVSPRDHPGAEADTSIVVVPRVSKGRILYKGREFPLHVNQAYLLDGRAGWSLVEDQRFRHLILSVPRPAVRRLALGGIRDPFMRPLTATATLVELIKSLVETRLNIDLLTDAIRETIADTLCGLLDTALDASEAPAHRHDRATVRKEEQIRRIHEYVFDHLADPMLSADSIASAIGVSPRHLHRLFSNEAQALGDLIRAERLDRCRAALSAPGNSQSISAVAYAWGFNDAAHFSRAFRQRFGMTPREARVGT